LQDVLLRCSADGSLLPAAIVMDGDAALMRAACRSLNDMTPEQYREAVDTMLGSNDTRLCPTVFVFRCLFHIIKAARYHGMNKAGGTSMKGW
jgi:hypothetical protein